MINFIAGFLCALALVAVSLYMVVVYKVVQRAPGAIETPHPDNKKAQLYQTSDKVREMRAELERANSKAGRPE